MSGLIPSRPDLPPPPGGGAWVDPVPKATWKWYVIIPIAFGALLLGAIPAALVYLASGKEPSTAGTLGGLDFFANALDQLVVLGVLLVYLHLRHPGWRRVIRFPSRREAPKELGIGVGLGIAATVALGIVVSVLLQPLFRSITDRDVKPAEQVGTGIGGWGAVAFVVAVVIVAPVVEEFLFRGLLFRSLRDPYGFWVGALGSAFVFALAHTGQGGLADVLLLQIAIGLFGVFLAWIYEWRGSLGANIVAHATFNLITVLTVLKVFG